MQYVEDIPGKITEKIGQETFWKLIKEHVIPGVIPEGTGDFLGHVTTTTAVIGLINTGLEITRMIREAQRNGDRLQLSTRPTQRLIDFNQVNQMSCVNILNTLEQITSHHNQLVQNIKFSYGLEGAMDDQKKQEMNLKIAEVEKVYQNYKNDLVSYCDNYASF